MSKRKDKRFFSKREWLNPKNSDDTGAIHSTVEVESWGYVSVNVSIWDCSRKVSLDLGFSGEKEAKKRAIKVQSLINHLTAVQKAMGEAYKYAQIIKEADEIEADCDGD